MVISLSRKIEKSENYILPDGEIGIFTTDRAKNIEMVVSPNQKPTTGLSLIMCAIFLRLNRDEKFSTDMLKYASDNVKELENTFGMDIDADLLRNSIYPN